MLSKWFAGALLAFVMGCSGEGFEFAPVTGKVTIEGQPAVDFHVSFEPIASGKSPISGPGSVGVTDSEGKFSLLSVPNKSQGAVVGKHRVRIVVQRRDSEDEDAVVARLKKGDSFQQLPPKYHDSTELTFDVPAQGSNKANFELTWQ